MFRPAAIAALACALVVSSAGCDNRGPAEKAGAKIDRTADTIKNGGHEPVSDSVKDDLDKARDEAKDAADKPRDK